MSAVLTEVADDPWQVCRHHLMIRVGGPKALRVKFLERPAREFEPADFQNFLCGVHGLKIAVIRAANKPPLAPRAALRSRAGD